jgi:CheY-like chemotaxis protein
MHILLVEDNVGDARLLFEALREQCLSCQLSVVEDGEQALAFLGHEGAYTTATRPDLILLDLNLPKTDGRVVLQTLRATPEWKTLPIMILTGVLQDADQQQAAALRVERFLQKPTNLEGYLALGEDIATWWEIRTRSPQISGTPRDGRVTS